MARKYGPEDEWNEKVKSKKETSMSLSEAEKKIAEFREKLDL